MNIDITMTARGWILMRNTETKVDRPSIDIEIFR